MTPEVINSLSVILPGLGFMWALYRNANKAKAELVAEIKRSLAADAAEQKKSSLPQPLLTKEHKDAFTRADHDLLCNPLHQRVTVLEGDVRAIRLTMAADKNELLDAGEDRAKDIHRRIDDLKTEIAAAPARTVALLKDTKGLL
jgi:hypothetical protein